MTRAVDQEPRGIGKKKRGEGPARFGLRTKLLLVSLVLVFLPLAVVWSVGMFEGIDEARIARSVIDASKRISEVIHDKHLRVADLPRHGALLATLAHRYGIMIRVLDAEGHLVQHTKPNKSERRSFRGLLRRAANFFFGPSGPPDLLAYEATLPKLALRSELQKAAAGHPGQAWRAPDDGSMAIFYHARPIAGGVLYLTRLSRRNVRALYGMRYQLLKLTLIIGAIGAAFALFVGWRLVRPMVVLQRRIRQEMDHPAAMDPQRLVLSRRDEIGELSRDFARLTETLARHLSLTTEHAADLAHDLKNGVSTVVMTSELIAGDADLSRERRDRLAHALSDAARRLERSAEGMLDLARLDEELATSRQESVDLHALVSRVVESYRASAPGTILRYQNDVGGEIRVRGVEGQLERVLRNLVDNALIFASSQVVVTVSRGDDAGFNLSVADDGEGISDDNAEKIFRRFFTARPAAVAPGTGLGLAICAAIVRAHGGEIILSERAPEESLRGAHFVVSLAEDIDPKSDE